MSKCYYQGCTERGSTKEHVPPKAFFPKDQREQLLTVPSCPQHNNDKSTHDLYVLAHTCMNASPTNGARDIFMTKVLPQLGYNDGALRKTLAANAIRLANGTVKYPVDKKRFEAFFDALSFGIVYASQKAQLPPEYQPRHIFHAFVDDGETEQCQQFTTMLDAFCSEADQLAVLNFGSVKTLNASIYSVRLYGLPCFQSSITVVHTFFGAFRVTSMLTRLVCPPA